MTVFRGTWRARVEQEFEVEANSEEEATEIVERDEMQPSRVVELLDFELEFDR